MNDSNHPNPQSPTTLCKYDDASSVDSSTSLISIEERDEIEEIHKWTSKQTRNIFVWRFAVTALLVLTALLLTLATYYALYNDQDRSFRTGVSLCAALLNYVKSELSHIWFN